MKSKRLIVSVLGLAVGILFVLLIWKPVLEITFAFSQGQDPVYDMGSGYKLFKPGRSIYYWPINEESREVIITNRTVEFAVTDSWLFGKTEKGWFGINKKTQELFYPYLSKQRLQKDTGVNLATLVFSTDLRPYAEIQPWTPKNMRFMKSILSIIIIVLPLFIALMCYAIGGRKIKEG